MRTNPRRQRINGGGKAFSLIRAGRDVMVGQGPILVERGGYQIEVKRTPSWKASTQTGSPFHRVESFGKTREDAVCKLLERIDTLKARAA